jgi:hypothetical protein
MEGENLAARTQLGYTITIVDLNFANKNNGSRAQPQSCHSDQYLAEIEIAVATNTATQMAARNSDGLWVGSLVFDTGK